MRFEVSAVRVEVLDETGRFRQRSRLAEVLRRVAVGSGLDAPGDAEEREVTIVLVDDAAICERNRRDRAVDGPTDVLSYPLAEPDDLGFPPVPHLGDVVVSLDTAARQARGRRPVWHEVAVLATHGWLHLHGYDHQEPADWASFDACQALAEAEARSLDLAVVARRILRRGRA
jgi:probable rRNA maturation factor